MLRWTRRIISALLALFLSLWKFPVLQFILLLLGIPGLIDDTSTWFKWMNEIELPHYAYFIGMFVAASFGTAEWWFPRVARVFCAQKANAAHTALPIDEATQDQGERFKALVPNLQRLANFCRPRDALSLQMLIVSDTLTLPNIRADCLEVCAVLRSLGIKCPSTEFARGSEGWFSFAIIMIELANQGNLTEAQEAEFGCR